MVDDRKSKSTTEKLLEQREKRKEHDAAFFEGKEIFTEALNGIASTPNGKIVFQSLIERCGVFSPDTGTDVASLIRQSERRNVYLELIRPHLERQVRQELEN